MRQGILLGHFLCDRVQGVENFATHPRHFPSQVPPPGFYACKFIFPNSFTFKDVFLDSQKHFMFHFPLASSLAQCIVWFHRISFQHVLDYHVVLAQPNLSANTPKHGGFQTKLYEIQR